MESQTTGGVTTTFGWDDASRLESWACGADSAAYTYDAAGQRTASVVAQASVTTTTTYTYDGITLLSLAAERSDETTYSVAYLYDEDARPYAGVYASSETSVPVTFPIATTDRGDVAALTDTVGAPFARYTYDPYGRVLSQDSDAAGGITAELAEAIATRQPLRYAGYAYDAHSATYYLSQRHYGPATMRFLTKDPARDDGEESAYQYCAGDPVGRVDPSGEIAWAIAPAAVLPILAAVIVVSWMSLPPDIRYDVNRQVSRSLTRALEDARTAVKKLKQRCPQDKWTVHAFTEKAHAPYPSTMKGSKAKRVKWAVSHPHNRTHIHVEIRRNGARHWRSPGI